MLLTSSDGYEHLRSDSSIECFISFLKQNNVLDEFISSSRQVSSLMTEVSPTCLRGVDLEKQKLLSQAHFQLRHKTSYECLRKATEDDKHFLNLLLNLRVVKSLSESGIKKMNSIFSRQKTPKEIAVDRVEKQLRDVLSQSEVKCDSESEFGNLFDSYFKLNSDDFERYNDLQEHCIRLEVETAVKHLNIEVNPKNLETDNIDCSKALEAIKAEIIDSSKDIDEGIKSYCIRSMLRENNDYFHSLLIVEVLSSLNLNADQQNRERQKFIDNLVEITLKVRERCW